MRFHPLGIDGYKDIPFTKRIDRMLVVSPFVSSRRLRMLTEQGKEHVLVSRHDELDALNGKGLESFVSVHTLNDASDVEEKDEDTAAIHRAPTGVPKGLHAKIYVVDEGGDAHVWTGSANATDAAFEQNVELLVQLTGRKKDIGVEATLTGSKGDGLREILVPYVPPRDLPAPFAVDKRLERRLRDMLRCLARTKWVAAVGPLNQNAYPFALQGKGDACCIPEHTTVCAWPISLHENQAIQLPHRTSDITVNFGQLSFEALTSFISFRVQVTEGETSIEETFALNVTTDGFPADRVARIVHAMLDEPSKFARLLRVLLDDDMTDFDALDSLETRGTHTSASNARASLDEATLFEELIKALHRDPSRLDLIENLVRDLRSVDGGARSLPTSFWEIWEPLAAARRALNGSKRGRR